MNLLEHEGKRLFREYGVPVPEGTVISSSKYASAVSKALGGDVVIKVQLPTGKRGKSGGIMISSKDPAEDTEKLFNKKFNDIRPQQILIEKKVNIQKELYLSLAVSRSHQGMIKIFSEEGGVDIESVSEDKILKRRLDEKFSLKDKKLERQLNGLTKKLLKLMEEQDAILVEINPLGLTKEGLIALDSKIVLDDNAEFRHSDRKLSERGLSDSEKKAKRYGIHYVELAGNIGIIGNGAGLVMGTLDMIKHKRGNPADFLDVGGGADRKVMDHALDVCLDNKRVKGIMINIFGGITHCDEIAKGIIAFKKRTKLKRPLVVRMIGTNEDEAKELLKKEGIDMYDSMVDCARVMIKKVGS